MEDCEKEACVMMKLDTRLIGHPVVAHVAGLGLCRTAPWDYYWDTVASFNFLFLGCAGNWSKFTLHNSPTVH